MTPEEVGARLARLLGGENGDAPVVSVSGGGVWARATVDVSPARWRDALHAARDDAELGCDFFDWLSAVDELDEGFRIVAHVWSTTRRRGVLVRTLIARAAPALASVVDLFVRATMAYSNSGEGLHRFVDPADGQTYLYANPFLDAAQRIFACFDQPDLKAPVTLAVAAPPAWTVLANGAGVRPAPGC